MELYILFSSFISLISLITLMILILISINGYGRLISFFFKIDNLLIHDYKSIEFIIGLIFLGSVGICINFYLNISDILSITVISIGILFYIFFLIKLQNKKKEFYFILFIISLSTIISFYALTNDDFDYHYKIIQNYKELRIFDIIDDGRRMGYNSHWLFLTSLFYISIFPTTIFCLGSLLYSLIVYDFYKAFKKNYAAQGYLAKSYAALVLIFLIGVVNIYKDFGTDFPGQAIILLICLIYFDRYNAANNNNNQSIFFLLLSLSFFIFTVKLTNILIFILLLIIFLQMKSKIYVFIASLFFAIPSILWMTQNYIISKCLLWPIYITCFERLDNAKREFFWIEAFAKSFLDKGYTQAEIAILNEGFNWFPVWFFSHMPKVLETYLVYCILILFPIIIFQFSKNFSKTINNNNNKKINQLSLNFNNPFFVFSFFASASLIIWFIQAPSVRFGFSYILNFILVFFLLFWCNIVKINKIFFNLSINILLLLSLSYFLYKNITKPYNYIERYSLYWPNVVEGKYIYK